LMALNFNSYIAYSAEFNKPSLALSVFNPDFLALRDASVLSNTLAILGTKSWRYDIDSGEFRRVLTSSALYHILSSVSLAGVQFFSNSRQIRCLSAQVAMASLSSL
jgi:hypothetical protein